MKVNKGRELETGEKKDKKGKYNFVIAEYIQEQFYERTGCKKIKRQKGKEDEEKRGRKGRRSRNIKMKRGEGSKRTSILKELREKKVI